MADVRFAVWAVCSYSLLYSDVLDVMAVPRVLCQFLIERRARREPVGLSDSINLDTQIQAIPGGAGLALFEHFVPTA